MPILVEKKPYNHSLHHRRRLVLSLNWKWAIVILRNGRQGFIIVAFIVYKYN